MNSRRLVFTNETPNNVIQAQRIGADTKLEKVTIQLLEELKQYRDLEEQGLLFRLPCKVGDTVYRLVPKTYRKISQIKIVRFVVDENGFGFIGHGGLYHSCKEIGKTVFLTQSEAEEELEKSLSKLREGGE